MKKKNKKILIIDDDPPILELYEIWLASWGYEVITAKGGREALDMVGSSDYDLVICDAVMPDISGLEVRKKMFDSCPDTPFILVSGFSSDDRELKEILSMKVAKHIQKPVDFPMLKKDIERFISHKGTAANLAKLPKEKQISKE